MKTKKTSLVAAIALTFLGLTGSSHAVVSVGFVSTNDTSALGGRWADSSGSIPGLTAGGMSLGFFSISTPDATAWSNLKLLTADGISSLTVYSSLVSTYGWKNLATTMTGATSTLDSVFPTTGGTVSNITLGNAAGQLAASTKIWALAFNGGSLGTNFAAATQWAAVSGTTWVSVAADNTGNSVKMSTLAANATDVPVGTKNGVNGVNLFTAPVAGVPEPSRFLLTMMGAGVVFFRRRR